MHKPPQHQERYRKHQHLLAQQVPLVLHLGLDRVHLLCPGQPRASLHYLPVLPRVLHKPPLANHLNNHKCYRPLELLQLNHQLQTGTEWLWNHLRR